VKKIGGASTLFFPEPAAMNAQKTRLAIVIPARYQSVRLPGKPLADIHGKPMIQHVYERALEVPEADTVLVATDDERIRERVIGFHGNCLMTASSHPSGTDRLTEVMDKVDADIYINLQCDEPLVCPADISTLASAMCANISVEVGTLCYPISYEQALNPNTVKVVLDAAGNALYFSRAPIPYPRNPAVSRYFKHVGIYAYRREVLALYAGLHQPMMEQAELLEQLRLLNVGFKIRVVEIAPTGPGVDTPECLERVRTLMTATTT
jgi:3-deoxy-manno-octulosonate cytidylyltransferase (CMP-KDO synthetase)